MSNDLYPWRYQTMLPSKATQCTDMWFKNLTVKFLVFCFYFFFPSCIPFPVFPFPTSYFSTLTFSAVIFGFVFSSCCVLFAIIKELLRHDVCTADSKQFRAAYYGAECLQMWFYSTWVQLTPPDRLSGRDTMISIQARTEFSCCRPWTSK